MAESITISDSPPALKSMQYAFLREEGLKHIERLAAKIWTDYNESDPGITLLEALSYAITDLGYRSNYSIPDILAQNPLATPVDIKNFYSARQILPISPVTFNDYRKTLIDVEVHDPLDLDCPLAGVKNAWIEKSPDNEIPVYLNHLTDALDYVPVDPNNPQRIDIKVLYDILLEFDRCENLGDLNENTIEERIKIYSCSPSLSLPTLDPALSGLSVKVEVEFARWDALVDWNDFDAIKLNIKNIVLDFDRLPIGYKIQGYGLLPDKSIWLSITKGATNTPVDTQCIIFQLQALLYGTSNVNSFVIRYQKKVQKVQEIVAAVRKRLMENRNLCEDFFRINALKVEEIALCADVVVANDADLEEVLAKIYFEVGNFLSPTVYFHTLSEMYDKGYKTEEIFEGPRLDHGFIDTPDLEKADRKKSIHVSDLIQIIMNVPGVLAINSIQIANIPLDNVDNIPSVSVKWCLELAFEKNYIPRLAIDRTSITFFKDQLPYVANEAEVDFILEDFIKEQRPQKLHDIPLDLPVPQGTYKDIEDYVSVQDEFPLVYGTGAAGLSNSVSELRKAQAKQLKGFLMFFDQLLADYLSQLANIRTLFSMNGERDANGNFVIDKTYFSQSLIPYVPDVLPLLVNPSTYPDNLQNITEDDALFDERRNRFLDHLMARFSEQFTDYTMLVYRLEGPKAPDELLEDKLRFLDEYPSISGDRFKAFNYESPCKIWHVDNVSGLEKRISLLTGIDPLNAQDLIFNDAFSINTVGSDFEFSVDIGLLDLLISASVYESVDKAKLGIEKLIINAVDPDKYIITNGVDETVTVDSGDGPFRVKIICGDEILAQTDPLILFPDMTIFRNAALAVFEKEFYDNHESNRNNLACPLFNYFNVVDPIVVNMVSDPPIFYMMFDLFEEPFIFDDSNKKLLTGAFVSADNQTASVEILDVNPANFTITVANNLTSQLPVGITIDISGSATNDGTYTVLSVESLLVSGDLITVVELDNTPVLSATAPLGFMDFIIQTAFKGNGDCKSSETIQDIDLLANSITLSGDFSPWININDPITIDNSAVNDGNYTVSNITVNPILPNGFETILEFNEVLVGTTLPLGVLKYNKQSAAELLAFAEEQKEKFIFEIAFRGIDSNNYLFTDYLIEPYRFFITDKCSSPIATAIEINYNLALANAIENHNGTVPPDTIEIVNSTDGNDAIYTVVSALPEGREIKIIVVGVIPSLVADGLVRFLESDFNVVQVLSSTKQFLVATNLSRKLFVGEGFTIYGSTDNNGTFSIVDIIYDPIADATLITVKETVNAPTTLALGDLAYVKELEILRIVQGPNSEIYVKGGADDAAVQEMIRILKSQFFSHEGLHIVEHVLLRPKYNENIFIPFDEGGTPLDNSIVALGDWKFMKKLPIASIDPVTNEILVLTDITSELTGLVLQDVFIKGSDFAINDGTYKLLSFSFTFPHTRIKVFQNIPTHTLVNKGNFIYSHTVAISSVASTTSIIVPVPDAEISKDFPATILNSENGINDGNFHIENLVIVTPTSTEIIFDSRETLVSDDLLPINLLADCFSCKITDPYSFIMTVVLPAWQGRFANQDFRAFFDRSFRLECPAHLVPNLCWIDCMQMAEFEKRYKKWLIENSETVKSPLKLSNALNDLIEIITQLRSVYPEGTLHDCNVDNTIDNAIILNRTIIGTN